MGPNEKKLIFQKMSRDAIPSGGGVADGVRFLADSNRVKKTLKAATQWVSESISAVQQSDDNPYGDDREAICGEILRRLK